MYLLSQILLFLGLAALLGFLCGWFFGRCACDADEVRERHGAAEAVWRRENAELRAKLTGAAPAADNAATLANVNAMAATLAAKLETAEAARAALEAERNAALRDADALRIKLGAAAPPAAGEDDLKAKLAAAEDARRQAVREADELRAERTTTPDKAALESEWTARLTAAEKARAEAEAARMALQRDHDDCTVKLSAADHERVALQRRCDNLEAEIARLRAGAGSAIGLIGATAPASVTNANFTPSSLALLDTAGLEAAVLAAGDGAKPLALASALGEADDLKVIGGVGPALEAWLNEQGIFHYWQIATMEAPELAWLANHLPHFGSRVYREHWIEQAIRLARGEDTDAKQKYQDGKHT